MNPKRSLGAVVSAVFVLALGGSGCAKEKASAPEAPVSAGYEAAIAKHATKPIFRPTGTAPAVWGPGDLYNFLVTGEESNNAIFQFEAVVPATGGKYPKISSM